MAVWCVPETDTSVSSSTSRSKKAALVGWPSNGLDCSSVLCQSQSRLLRVLVPDQELVIDMTLLAIDNGKKKINNNTNLVLPDYHCHQKQVPCHRWTISARIPEELKFKKRYSCFICKRNATFGCSWYNEKGARALALIRWDLRFQLLKSSPQTCGQQACWCSHLRLAYRVEVCSGLGFLKLISVSSMPRHQFLFDVRSLFGPSCIECHPKPITNAWINDHPKLYLYQNKETLVYESKCKKWKGKRVKTISYLHLATVCTNW